MNFLMQPSSVSVLYNNVTLMILVMPVSSNFSKNYVDLYSASSRSASNALPLPVSRH